MHNDVDGALLDMNLGNKAIQSAANKVSGHGILAILVMDYGAGTISKDHAHISPSNKPLFSRDLVCAVGGALMGGAHC